MYEKMTRGVKVAVKPAFLDDQSDPDEGQYLWSYTVTIENKGAEPVQLLSRYWTADGVSPCNPMSTVEPMASRLSRCYN